MERRTGHEEKTCSHQCMSFNFGYRVNESQSIWHHGSLWRCLGCFEDLLVALVGKHLGVVWVCNFCFLGAIPPEQLLSWICHHNLVGLCLHLFGKALWWSCARHFGWPLWSKSLHFSVHLGHVDWNSGSRNGTNISKWSDLWDDWCGASGGISHFARYLYWWRNCSSVHLYHWSWSKTLAREMHGTHWYHMYHGPGDFKGLIFSHNITSRCFLWRKNRLRTLAAIF